MQSLELVLSALCAVVVLPACSEGGQTGDITQLSPCRQVVDSKLASADFDGFDTSIETLVNARDSPNLPFEWEARIAAPVTTVSVNIDIEADTVVDVLGGPGCTQTTLVTNINLDIATADRRLGEAFGASLELNDENAGTIGAVLPVRDLQGTLDPFAGTDEQRTATSFLVFDITLFETGVIGQVFLKVREDDDEEMVGTWGMQ